MGKLAVLVFPVGELVKHTSTVLYTVLFRQPSGHHAVSQT